MTAGGPRLWVVDPSIHHAEREGVEQVLQGWPGRSRLFLPALRPGDGPRPRDGYDTDGIVILGSGASVHDDLPWLSELSAWLAPVLEGTPRLPVLAICFGHQLVAHLAGAAIGLLHPGGAKEIGVRESRLEDSELLPGDRRLEVVVSHREEIKTVPPDYRVVARREGVDVDGLEHERLPVFTFQFHPEARGEFFEQQGIPPDGLGARVVEDGDRLLAAFRSRVLHE
jgi:GMP synthase-like glutamine amidotransferase